MTAFPNRIKVASIGTHIPAFSDAASARSWFGGKGNAYPYPIGYTMSCPFPSPASASAAETMATARITNAFGDDRPCFEIALDDDADGNFKIINTSSTDAWRALRDSVVAELKAKGDKKGKAAAKALEEDASFNSGDSKMKLTEPTIKLMTLSGRVANVKEALAAIAAAGGGATPGGKASKAKKASPAKKPAAKKAAAAGAGEDDDDDDDDDVPLMQRFNTNNAAGADAAAPAAKPKKASSGKKAAAAPKSTPKKAAKRAPTATGKAGKKTKSAAAAAGDEDDEDDIPFAQLAAGAGAGAPAPAAKKAAAAGGKKAAPKPRAKAKAAAAAGTRRSRSAAAAADGEGGDDWNEEDDNKPLVPANSANAKKKAAPKPKAKAKRAPASKKTAAAGQQQQTLDGFLVKGAGNSAQKAIEYKNKTDEAREWGAAAGSLLSLGDDDAGVDNDNNNNDRNEKRMLLRHQDADDEMLLNPLAATAQARARAAFDAVWERATKATAERLTAQRIEAAAAKEQKKKQKSEEEAAALQDAAADAAAADGSNKKNNKPKPKKVIPIAPLITSDKDPFEKAKATHDDDVFGQEEENEGGLTINDILDSMDRQLTRRQQKQQKQKQKKQQNKDDDDDDDDDDNSNSNSVSAAAASDDDDGNDADAEQDDAEARVWGSEGNPFRRMQLPATVKPELLFKNKETRPLFLDDIWIMTSERHKFLLVMAAQGKGTPTPGATKPRLLTAPADLEKFLNSTMNNNEDLTSSMTPAKRGGSSAIKGGGGGGGSATKRVSFVPLSPDGGRGDGEDRRLRGGTDLQLMAQHDEDEEPPLFAATQGGSSVGQL